MRRLNEPGDPQHDIGRSLADKRGKPSGSWRYGGLLLLASITSAADAQTSVLGVAGTRLDQNPISAAAQKAPAGPPREAAEDDKHFAPFVLKRVDIEGSSLTNEQLAASRAFIGRAVDDQVLTQITASVAAAYASSDIALYTILVPQQSFADGTLRLTIVEGYVSAVEVRGKLRSSRRPLLRAYLRRLEDERPLHTSTLQRIISLIRDMPGFFPDVQFLQGSAQGAVKLVIAAHEKPVQIAVGANDRGTALLGRTQLQGDVYLNALLSGGDQLHATLVAPTHVSHFQYYAASYLAPLDANGTSVQVNLGYLRTRPPILDLADQTIRLKGHSFSFGGQASKALIRDYAHSLNATLGFDAIDSHDALLGIILSNDRVRTVRAALAFAGSSKRNQLNLSATISFGIDGLGARTVPGQADPSFRKLNVKLGENRQLGRDFALRLAGFGQLSADLLPASEQIALGGDEFGRAYAAASIAGDEGYAGSAELAWHPSKGIPASLLGSELYAFGDAGRVTYRGRFGLPATASHLASVGGGARVEVAKRTIFQLEAARGLNNPVSYEDRERWRLVFGIRSLL